MIESIGRCLRNILTSLVIPCFVRRIPSVLILGLYEEPLENEKVLLISDTCKQYSCNAQVFSTEQAARLCQHKNLYN